MCISSMVTCKQTKGQRGPRCCCCGAYSTPSCNFVTQIPRAPLCCPPNIVVNVPIFLSSLHLLVNAHIYWSTFPSLDTFLIFPSMLPSICQSSHLFVRAPICRFPTLLLIYFPSGVLTILVVEHTTWMGHHVLSSLVVDAPYCCLSSSK